MVQPQQIFGMILPGIKSKTGFTLIEIILYIGILSLILTSLIEFSWLIIYSFTKSNTQQELNSNLRLVTNRLVYEIHNATGINSISSTSLSLSNSDPTRNPTIFSLTGNSANIGYGHSGLCPITNPCALTSSNIFISNLQFLNLSPLDGKSLNIKFSLTASMSGSSRQEYQTSQSYNGSAEVQLK